MSDTQQREHLGQQEEIAARKMGNAVHMLVVTLWGVHCVWIWFSSALLLEEESLYDDDGKESVPIAKFAVEQAMESNRDACYP